MHKTKQGGKDRPQQFIKGGQHQVSHLSLAFPDPCARLFRRKHPSSGDGAEMTVAFVLCSVTALSVPTYGCGSRVAGSAGCLLLSQELLGSKQLIRRTSIGFYHSKAENKGCAR